MPLEEKRRPAREGRAIVGIRPEDFEDAAYAESGRPEVEVEVAVVEELGAEAHVIFPVDAAPVEAEDLRAVHDEGESERQLLADDARALFTARVDARTGARAGQQASARRQPGGVPLLRSPRRARRLAAAAGERELQTALGGALVPPRRRRGRIDEARQLDVGLLDQPAEGVERPSPRSCSIGCSTRRQVRLRPCGGDAVEADDRELLGNAQAERRGLLEDADRDEVVRADHSGRARPRREQPARGLATPRDGEGRVRDEAVLRLEPGLEQRRLVAGALLPGRAA